MDAVTFRNTFRNTFRYFFKFNFKFQIDDDDVDNIAGKKTFSGGIVILYQTAINRIYRVHFKDYENKYLWK